MMRRCISARPLEVDALLGQVAGHGFLRGEARQTPAEVRGPLDPLRRGVEAVPATEALDQALDDALNLRVAWQRVFQNRHVLGEKGRQRDVPAQQHEGALVGLELVAEVGDALDHGGVLDHVVPGHDEEQDAVGGQLQGLLEQQGRGLHGVVGAAQVAGLGGVGQAAVALQTIPGPQAGRFVLLGQHLGQRALALPVIGSENQAPRRSRHAQAAEVFL